MRAIEPSSFAIRTWLEKDCLRMSLALEADKDGGELPERDRRPRFELRLADTVHEPLGGQHHDGGLRKMRLGKVLKMSPAVGEGATDTRENERARKGARGAQPLRTPVQIQVAVHTVHQASHALQG